MSRAQDPPRGFFPFGNPFRMLSPKGSDLSPWLLSLLNGFELHLAERLKKLIPKNKEEDILSLSWMKLAMESLCETHRNINTLITDLHLPVSDWEEKWVDVYLDISVKLLDLCNAFSSELTRLNQGDLFLKCALHNLQSDSGEKYLQARSSLDSWKQHVNANNPRIETCRAVLNSLVKSLTLPKVKNSPKGKVLMRAFYGVKVQTVYICSAFTAAWSDSTKDLFDLPVSEKPLWAKTFTDLQSVVNAEIREMLLSSGKTTILKELETVDKSVEKLYPMIQDGVGGIGIESFEDYVMELKMKGEKLSHGLDQVLEEVDSFFKMILSGRDVLLCNLRSSDSISVGEDVD